VSEKNKALIRKYVAAVEPVPSRFSASRPPLGVFQPQPACPSSRATPATRCPGPFVIEQWAQVDAANRLRQIAAIPPSSP
jgi:hypothetical protein